METVVYEGQTLSRWRVGNSTFLALPERGARLMNWHVTLGDGSVRDVIYWPEHADFANIAKVRGGNPILFPFCGRTFDHGVQNLWRAPDGVQRPMPMHGFARQGAFKLVWSDARGFSALLVPDAPAQEAYPFSYEFTVTYRFDALSLACELTLKNLDAVPLPWCAGHHFYFTAPWSEGTRREDCAIRIPAAEVLRQTPTGELIAGPQLTDEENLANPELIDAIYTRLQSSSVVFGEQRRPGRVTVQIGTAKTAPADTAFVTWAPGPDTPYYCVEPWMGPPNAPEHQRGLQFVPPRESRSFTVSVAIR